MRVDLVMCLVYHACVIVNMHEAKTHLSKYVARALEGEEIIIAKNNKPVCKLTPFNIPLKKRQPGLSKGLVEISPDFDAPLPEEIIARFES